MTDKLVKLDQHRGMAAQNAGPAGEKQFLRNQLHG
jgi:hypothetical protein